MSKIVRRIAVVAVAAATGLVGFAGASSASAVKHVPNPTVAWVSEVIVSPSADAAYVIGHYRCYGGRAGTHVWVSVKEGPNVKAPDNLESSDARAWYDTNWNYANSPAGLTANCNGKWHTATITLKAEQGPFATQKLYNGRGYVQFCLFDSTGDPSGMDLSHGFAYNYGFKHIARATT